MNSHKDKTNVKQHDIKGRKVYKDLIHNQKNPKERDFNMKKKFEEL